MEIEIQNTKNNIYVVFVAHPEYKVELEYIFLNESNLMNKAKLLRLKDLQYNYDFYLSIRAIDKDKFNLDRINQILKTGKDATQVINDLDDLCQKIETSILDAKRNKQKTNELQNIIESINENSKKINIKETKFEEKSL